MTSQDIVERVARAMCVIYDRQSREDRKGAYALSSYNAGASSFFWDAMAKAAIKTAGIEALTKRVGEALFAIADGEGDAQVIARQTLEQCGLPVPCEDEGCPHHGTRHACINIAALNTVREEEK